MDLATVATELYGLTLEQFTAARNRSATSAGDPDLTQQIRRLPKPSAAAWMVNMLVREGSAEIEKVLDLGESLRSAQESLDAPELRALGAQRSRLISAVAERGAAIARDLGHTPSASTIREVEQTLTAAMADPTAAAAVQSGWLAKALSPSGVDPADLTDAVAIPTKVEALQSPDSRTARRTVDSAANNRQLDEAKRKVVEAERKAEEAGSALESIEKRMAELVSTRARLAAERKDLEKQLSESASAIAELDRDARALQVERERAARVDDQANSAADRARQRWHLLT